MRLLILLLPWLELFTLIKLGVETSALVAILYVFTTLMLGVAVVRRQGRGMFLQLREAQQGKVLGAQLLRDEMAMGLAGLLLIFPGLITDAAALVVLVGPLRRRLTRALRGPQPEPYVAERDADGHLTIEGDFRRTDR
jgi:UPF0716 protein FxsA